MAKACLHEPEPGRVYPVTFRLTLGQWQAIAPKLPPSFRAVAVALLADVLDSPDFSPDA